MNHGSSRLMAATFLATLVCSVGREIPARADDRCDNKTLEEVFNIIHAACTEERCDPTRLKEITKSIERWKVLTAMRTLFTVHMFFPKGKTDIESSLDLSTTTSDQQAMLQREITKPYETVVYVVGRGSSSGSDRTNWEISRERTLAVYNYLVNDLKLKCRFLQKVAFGKTILQLTVSDAKLLNIAEGDYRSDENVLNQSVEIFVYPCRNRLREVEYPH